MLYFDFFSDSWAGPTFFKNGFSYATDGWESFSVGDNSVHSSSRFRAGTIVLDVANFSVAAKRATAKDKRVFEQLSKIVPDVSKDDIYLQLQNAKANVSGLQFEQLLRKDVKVVQNDSFILAVSALPFLSSVFLAKYPDLQKKLYNFCLDYNYHGVVLVGIHIDQETDVVKRDILLFSSNTAVKNKVNELCVLQLGISRK